MTTKIPIELSSTPGIVDNSNTTALTLDALENATFAGTVTGSRKLVLNASGTNDTHIEIGANTASNHYAFIDLVGDATYTDYGLRIIRNNGGANTSSFIYHRGTGNFNIETQDSASLKLRTAGADALTIDTSQRVGIGTTSPNQLLHLDNSASSSDSASIRIISGTAGLARIMLGDTGYGSRGRFVYDNSDDSLQLWGANSTTSAERMRISSSGSVGIGTSSPLNKLHVEGNIAQQGTASKSVSSGTGDSGISLYTLHNGYGRGSGRLRCFGTENNLNCGYVEYFYVYSYYSPNSTYYVNLKFIDEVFVSNTYGRPRLYLYNSSSYNNSSTNRQNTNQSTSSTNVNILQIGITNVANAYGSFQIVAEPMQWKP